MVISRRQGSFVALALLVTQATLAQNRPAVFVRLAGLSTPPVRSVEVLRQQRVELTSVSVLSSLQQSAVLQLDLFADVSFGAVRERLEPTAHGLSWVGALEGYPESTVLFVLVRDELIGCAGGRAGPHRRHSVNQGRENPVNRSYRLPHHSNAADTIVRGQGRAWQSPRRIASRARTHDAR